MEEKITIILRQFNLDGEMRGFYDYSGQLILQPLNAQRYDLPLKGRFTDEENAAMQLLVKSITERLKKEFKDSVD